MDKPYKVERQNFLTAQWDTVRRFTELWQAQEWMYRQEAMQCNRRAMYRIRYCGTLVSYGRTLANR